MKRKKEKPRQTPGQIYMDCSSHHFSLTTLTTSLLSLRSVLELARVVYLYYVIFTASPSQKTSFICQIQITLIQNPSVPVLWDHSHMFRAVLQAGPEPKVMRHSH